VVRQPPRRRLEIGQVAQAEDEPLALVAAPTRIDLRQTLGRADDLDAVMPAPAAQLREAGQAARQRLDAKGQVQLIDRERYRPRQAVN